MYLQFSHHCYLTYYISGTVIIFLVILVLSLFLHAIIIIIIIGGLHTQRPN